MLHKIANPISQCSLKYDNEEKGVFEAYASAFNSNDLVNDTILKGAFKGAEGSDFPLLLNHNQKDIPVGGFSGHEDDFGFKIRGSINMDHKDGPSAYSAMKLGHMTGFSIGFTMTKSDFDDKSDGGRTIKNLNLKEVSLVTFPCEPKAALVNVKALEDIVTVKDFENWLRDELDISKNMACALMSHFARIKLGEPVNHQEEIKALHNRLAAKDAVDSLIDKLKNI